MTDPNADTVITSRNARYISAALRGLAGMLNTHPHGAITTGDNARIVNLLRAAYELEAAENTATGNSGTSIDRIAEWRSEWRALFDRTTEYDLRDLPEFINEQTVIGRVETYDQDCYSTYPNGDYGTPDEAREFAHRLLAAANYHELATTHSDATPLQRLVGNAPTEHTADADPSQVETGQWEPLYSRTGRPNPSA